MLAIHNASCIQSTTSAAANAFAKLSKCQQFTTYLLQYSQKQLLQTLLQSYQNVSNSQRTSDKYIYCERCKRFCKVIKMLAIHNYWQQQSLDSSAANAFAKLSKCQQFTTRRFVDNELQRLQTLLQSYQNVSNSQLLLHPHLFHLCCKRFCKVIKMLAIHNKMFFTVYLTVAANAFAKLSKCQQFTTAKVDTK